MQKAPRVGLPPLQVTDISESSSIDSQYGGDPESIPEHSRQLVIRHEPSLIKMEHFFLWEAKPWSAHVPEKHPQHESFSLSHPCLVQERRQPQHEGIPLALVDLQYTPEHLVFLELELLAIPGALPCVQNFQESALFFSREALLLLPIQETIGLFFGTQAGEHSLSSTRELSGFLSQEALQHQEAPFSLEQVMVFFSFRILLKTEVLFREA